MTCYRNGSFGLALEQATQIYAHQTLLSIPSGEEIRKLHQFSDEYRRNMAGLMKGVAGNASRRRRQVYFLNVIYGMCCIPFTFSCAFFYGGNVCGSDPYAVGKLCYRIF